MYAIKKIRTIKMKMMLTCFVLSVIILLSAKTAIADEEANMDLDKSLEGIKLGVMAFMDYSAGQSALPGGDEENYNRFALTRGYFTVKKSLNDWLDFRMTSDLKQETKADGTKLNESYVIRIKYLYAELKPNDLGPFTDMKAEVGQGHTPWHDFEQKINPYRCQSKMPVEVAGIFNSADVGVGLIGNFGGSLDDAKKRVGNKKYAGRYGGWHIGVYNGGGYHAVENNQNKLFEGRVTVRPLPDVVPGLQFSYLYITGESNIEEGVFEDIPDYSAGLYMVSFQHPMIAATYQYYTTEGNAKGDYLKPNDDPLATEGWSAFVNVKVPGTDGKANLFGRYDWFDIDPDDEWADETAYDMAIAGVAFDVYKNNLLLFAWENTEYEKDADTKGHLPVVDNDLGKEQKFQVVWQIKL